MSINYSGIAPNFSGRNAYLMMGAEAHKEFYHALRLFKYDDAKKIEVVFQLRYRSPNYDAEYAKSNEDFSKYYDWDTQDLSKKEPPFLDIYSWKNYVNSWPKPSANFSKFKTWGPGYLFSEKLKNILSDFKISDHIFIPVWLDYKGTTKKYYAFFFFGHPFREQLNLQAMTFDISSIKTKEKVSQIEGKNFKNWDDYYDFTIPLRRQFKSTKPSEYVFKEHYDIFAVEQSVIINEKVLNLLLEQGIEPVKTKYSEGFLRYTGNEIIMPLNEKEMTGQNNA